MDWLDWLLENIQGITWQMAVMWVIGGVLIYLAIKKEMEPTLLLPMGLGAILVNLPMDGALKELQILYDAGIVTELFPLLLFIGIGAMIDFGPLLSNPKMILCGAAAQFGIFFTLSLARLLGFTLQDAASIAIIGAAGISAFPMSSRVVHKMGLKEDPQNFLLMHAAGANVAGQIASVIAGGMIISLIPTL